jgi:hypothetical protein
MFKQPANAERRYIVSGTLVFAVAEVLVFLPMVWPDGLHTRRDVVVVLLVVLVTIAGGLLFNVLRCRALQKWLGG